MSHQRIKSFFCSSVSRVASDISQYTVHSGKDLTPHKKLPAHNLISFLVSQGSLSTKKELLDFFDMDALAPTALTNSELNLNQMPWKLCLGILIFLLIL